MFLQATNILFILITLTTAFPRILPRIIPTMPRWKAVAHPCPTSTSASAPLTPTSHVDRKTSHTTLTKTIVVTATAPNSDPTETISTAPALISLTDLLPTAGATTQSAADGEVTSCATPESTAKAFPENGGGIGLPIKRVVGNA
ncbi:hypothetical protein G7Y89_g2431 [Cudoniella acicularis]|uniref:Uncharacterized protein n=1 Tax=Cudoniella acicularis TaxID=354080 RepID=A0A8H4W9D1_9HELO|nr:hypothetical protein G7Y89_g2431 [Cudoniella acicularis]